LLSSNGKFVYHPQHQYINKAFDEYAEKMIEGFNFYQLQHLDQRPILYGFDPYLKKESVFSAQKVKLMKPPNLDHINKCT
jgi:hypothetical protein